MTSYFNRLSFYRHSPGNKKTRIADGSYLAIAGSQTIGLSKHIVPHDVILVPKLSGNLLSISKLTQTFNYFLTFGSYHYWFQDIASESMIYGARGFGGLYVLEDDSSEQTD